jgi:parallel beta-helix repeat protein
VQEGKLQQEIRRDDRETPASLFRRAFVDASPFGASNVRPVPESSMQPRSSAFARRLGVAAALSLALVSAADAQGVPPAPMYVTASSMGALPNDAIDDTAALKAALEGLTDYSTFHFDLPGVYRVSGPMTNTAPTTLITIQNRTGVSITAVDGVRIEMTGFDRGNQTQYYPELLSVKSCTNFTMSGGSDASPLVVTMQEGDYAGPNPSHGAPFIQGTVLSAPTTTTVDLEISAEKLKLPFGLAAKAWGAWHVAGAGRPTNTMYSGSHATGIQITPLAAPNSFGKQPVRMTFPAQSWTQGFQLWPVGETVVAVLGMTDVYTIKLHSNNGLVTLRNIHAHHLPGKFMTATSCESLILDDVDCVPEDTTRKISVNRDGINASASSLQVVDCDIAFSGDDGIVAGGTPLGYVDGATVVVGTNYVTFEVVAPLSINPWATYARRGDTLAFLDGLGIVGPKLSATVTQMAQVTTASGKIQGNSARQGYTLQNPTSALTALLTQVSPTQPVYTYNATYSTVGASVEHCTVSGTRGIGIVVRGSNTTVSSCTVSDTSMCGLHAGGGLVNQYPWWSAGAPPHNLVVANSTFTRCGVNPWAATRGAIEIAFASGQTTNSTTSLPCTFQNEPVYSPTRDVIRNVTITDCTLTDFPRAGIFTANVGGIQVHGNTFANSGALVGCQPFYGNAVGLESCGWGDVSGNTYVNCQATHLYLNSPNVTWSP